MRRHGIVCASVLYVGSMMDGSMMRYYACSSNFPIIPNEKRLDAADVGSDRSSMNQPCEVCS